MDTTGGFSSQNGEHARGKSAGGEAQPVAVGGTVFKVPLGKSNTNQFRRVPRSFHARFIERDQASNPPLGCYRPKHRYISPRVAGLIPYDQYTFNGVS